MAEMCNQLLGLIASFSTALVTNRYFGVGHSQSNAWMPQVFDTKGAGFDWWYPHFSPDLGAVRQWTNRNHGSDNSDGAFPTEQFACKDINTEYPQSTLRVNVNQYYVPLLQQNPNYKDTMAKMGDDYFRPVARFLLQPTEDIASRVSQFISENFANKFVVGIHLRAGGAWPATQDQWQLYWKAAEQIEREHNKDGRDSVWFLAADMETARTAGKSQYGDKIVSYPSVFGNNDLGILYGVAFTDVLLLAECDHLVTSSWSTYSYVSVGLNGRKPYMITESAKPQTVDRNRGGAEVLYAGLEFWSNKRDSIKLQPTSQPCYHFYFNWRVQDVSCFTESMIDHEYFDGNRFC